MKREQRIAAICAEHAAKEGPLLPILHDIQTIFGCVDAAAEAQIAKALNLSRADIHGVVSFYHDYTAEADPRPTVEICRAEACKARGIEGMMAQAEAAAGNRVKLKTTYCLGLCSVGPAARVGGTLHARLDGEKLAGVIKSA